MFTEDDYRLVAQKLDSLIPHERAWRSSVAICIQRGSQLRTFGTGTLIRIGDQSFLVTAAHVLLDAKDQNLFLVPTDGQTVIPLEGVGLVSNNEAFDIVAFHLADQVVQQLGNAAFLRLDDVCFDQDLSTAMFALFGFPEIMCAHDKGVLKLTKFFFMAPAHNGPSSGLANFQPQHHILLDASLEDAKNVDGTPMKFCYQGGYSAPFPQELKGISGCGVWKIANSPSDTLRTGSEQARLVGVQTSVYHKHQSIRVTRWGIVRGLIRSARPDLGDVIDLWRPS